MLCDIRLLLIKIMYSILSKINSILRAPFVILTDALYDLAKHMTILQQINYHYIFLKTPLCRHVKQRRYNTYSGAV